MNIRVHKGDIVVHRGREAMLRPKGVSPFAVKWDNKGPTLRNLPSQSIIDTYAVILVTGGIAMIYRKRDGVKFMGILPCNKLEVVLTGIG